MIIGINGRVGSGKDTVGRLIQYLIRDQQGDNFSQNVKLETLLQSTLEDPFHSEWPIKKFASKLKQIASILTGIPVHMFEDQEFKKTKMDPVWNYDVEEKIHRIPLSDLSEALKLGAVFDSKNAYIIGATSGLCTPAKNLRVKVRFPEKTVEYTVREFLQRLGTEAIRNNIHTNVWVNALFADYRPELIGDITEQFVNTGKVETRVPNWLITDCRFPNEAQAIKERQGVVIRVTRPGENRTDLHPSETSLDDWSFDHTISNEGTIDDLVKKVQDYLKEVKIL